MIEGTLYPTANGYYAVCEHEIHVGTPVQILACDGQWYDGRMEMRRAYPGERVLTGCWGVWYVDGVGIAAQDLNGCPVRVDD